MLIVEPSQRVDLSVVLRPEQISGGENWRYKKAVNPNHEFEKKGDHRAWIEWIDLLIFMSLIYPTMSVGLQPLSATLKSLARFT